MLYICVKQNNIGMKLTDELKALDKGDSKVFRLESFSKAQTIRALVYRINKSNPVKYNLYTRIAGRELTVINGDDEKLTDMLRDIKPGESEFFDNGLYNKIHSISSHINEKDGSEIQVKKVVQVTNNNGI